MEPEVAIIVEAQSGSEPAWRRLFELHFDAVYRFSLALTAGRRELAEETTQQAFVAAAQRVGRYQPQQGPFRAWLFGIARNRYRTFQAKERRWQRQRGSLLRRAECGPTSRSEPDLGVHEALARLPLEYRRALEAKYLRRRSLKDMAEEEGMSVEAIESLLRRARDRFASVYGQMQDEG